VTFCSWSVGNPRPETWPSWLRVADIEWCQVSVSEDNRKVIWHDGVWIRGNFQGVWEDGKWLGGVFSSKSEWLNGEWLDGQFEGLWHNGTWWAGDFYGEWLAGNWVGGTCHGALWVGGCWRGGDWGLRKGSRGEAKTYVSSENDFGATIRCWQLDGSSQVNIHLRCLSKTKPNLLTFEGVLTSDTGVTSLIAEVQSVYPPGEHIRDLERLFYDLQDKYLETEVKVKRRIL
jgi:hypothetical protein